jgi:hypothetical protein
MSSGVEFEEDSFSYKPKPRLSGGPAGSSPGVPASVGNEPKMVQWLMRHGIAKSGTSAQVILIIVVIINIIITYVVIKYFL